MGIDMAMGIIYIQVEHQLKVIGSKENNKVMDNSIFKMVISMKAISIAIQGMAKESTYLVMEINMQENLITMHLKAKEFISTIVE